MPSYAEMTAWSLDEVRGQLREALPEGWKVERGDDAGHLWLRLLRPEGEGWAVEWDNYHFDERTLLLDAYCWLWLQTQPQPTRLSNWGRRQGELTSRGVTRRVLSSLPDPEDLDPDEILSVYDEAARKKRR